MTPAQALLAFTAAAAMLTVAPGLDTALVLRTAAVDGARRAMAAGIGICTGCLVWGVVVAAGLGALFAVSAAIYDSLRLVGACYLIWLGATLLRRGMPLPGVATVSAGGTTASRWFGRGILTNLLNPKVGLFYVTFLPQFIPQGVSVAGFSLLLAGIHAVLGLVWFALLSLAAEGISAYLRRPGIARALDRVTGGLFVAFGLALVAEGRRHG